METKHIFMTYENSISQCYNELCHCFWPNLSRNLSPKQLENFTRREYETISIQLREIFLLHLDLCGRNAQLIYSSSRLFARVNWMMSHAIEKFSRCSRRRVDVDLKFFHEWNSRLKKMSDINFRPLNNKGDESATQPRSTNENEIKKSFNWWHKLML